MLCTEVALGLHVCTATFGCLVCAKTGKPMGLHEVNLEFILIGHLKGFA
jgi:hypothetical protein